MNTPHTYQLEVSHKKDLGERSNQCTKSKGRLKPPFLFIYCLYFLLSTTCTSPVLFPSTFFPLVVENPENPITLIISISSGVLPSRCSDGISEVVTMRKFSCWISRFLFSRSSSQFFSLSAFRSLGLLDLRRSDDRSRERSRSRRFLRSRDRLLRRRWREVFGLRDRDLDRGIA